MRSTYSQSNFVRGEVSPYLQGRTDAEIYKSAVLEALNSTVIPLGPLARRKGLKYVAEVKDSSERVKLVPYRYTVDTSYVLEFGDMYIRFFTEQAQVLSGGVPLELTSPYTASEVADIQYTQVGTKLYIAHPNHAPQVLERLAPTSWTIGPIKLYPEPTFEDGFTSPVVSMTPGATSGSGVTFTADISYFIASSVGRQIVNLNGPGRASITSVTDSTHAVCTILEAFPSTATMPIGTWKLDLSPITTLTPSGTALGSIITITAASAAFLSELVTVNTYIHINGGVAKITGVTSETVCTAEVQKTLTSSAASNTFTFEVPSWSSTRGFPRAVAVYEQRLFFGGTNSDPVTIWGSASGDFTDYGRGANPADSVSFDLNNGTSVSWMSSNRELLIGGEAIEVSVSSGDNTALSPTNILQRSRTPHGSGPQNVLELPNEVIFIQRSGTKLRLLTYEYGVDSYSAFDLSLIANHIFEAGIVSTAYAQNPYQVIFSVLSDGTMASTTYLRQSQVTGGVLGTTLITTDGLMEDTVSVQNGPVDDVYVVVNRTINGATKRYVEVFMSEDGTDPTDIYSDCSTVYSNPKSITAISQANPGVVTANGHGFSNGDTVYIKNVNGMTEVNDHTFTVSGATTNTFSLSGVDTSGYSVYTSSGEVHKLVSTITGLSHLEGKTVQIKSDGATHPNLTVSSGSVTLQAPAAEVTVGLPYVTSITTLPLEFQGGEGPTMYGQRTRQPRPVLKVYLSTFPFLNGQLSPQRNTNDLMDMPVPLYTGNIEYGPTAWGDNGQLQITTANPFPLNIIGIYGTVEGGVKG